MGIEWANGWRLLELNPGPLRDVHAEVEADLVELGADLLERRLAEVADRQELVLRAADQVADGGDALALQAVGGADGQLQLGEAHVELALQLGVDRLGAVAVAAGGVGRQAG